MKPWSVCLWVLLAACRAKEPTALVTTNPVVTAKSWLALGDSYTIGQGVTATERFPAQTVALLQQRGIVVSALTYIATTGWTSSNLQTAVNTQNPAAHDVVSLLIGVNDQYQLGGDTTGYRQRFTQLLEKSIVLARGGAQKVVVLSIPDYSITPFAAGSDTARIRKELDLYNSINRSVTLAYGVAYLDITASTKEARTNTALLAADGLHPSAQEYQKWAQRLVPILEGMLK